MKRYNVSVNGNSYDVVVEEVGSNASGSVAPATPAPAVAKPAAPAPAAAATGATKVNAPMPGTILNIKVSQGQAVKKGDVLLVLEAMKMENEIASPCDGTVAGVHVTKGANVETNHLLVSIN